MENNMEIIAIRGLGLRVFQRLVSKCPIRMNCSWTEVRLEGPTEKYMVVPLIKGTPV